MEIVNFSTKTFKEIPTQDNPAFMSKQEFIEIGEPDGCILITMQCLDVPPYKNRGKYVVMKIDPVDNPIEEESVNQLGLFWDERLAIEFAELFINLNDKNISAI